MNLIAGGTLPAHVCTLLFVMLCNLQVFRTEFMLFGDTTRLQCSPNKFCAQLVYLHAALMLPFSALAQKPMNAFAYITRPQALAAPKRANVRGTTNRVHITVPTLPKFLILPLNYSLKCLGLSRTVDTQSTQPQGLQFNEATGIRLWQGCAGHMGHVWVSGWACVRCGQVRMQYTHTGEGKATCNAWRI